MKTIYARLGDLQLGETLEDGTTLGSVSSALESVGVEVLTTTGELRNMGDVIEDLMDKWGTLDTGTQQALAIKLAGKYQYNNLTALLENAEMYNEALETSENSLGTIDEQNEIYLDSLSAKLQAMQAAFEGFVNSIFNVDDIKPFIEAVTGLINLLTSFNTSIGADSAITGLISTFARVGKNSISATASNLYTSHLQKKDIEASKQNNIMTFFSGLDSETQSKVKNLANNSTTYQATKQLGQYQGVMTSEQRTQTSDFIKTIAASENNLISTQDKLRKQINAINKAWEKTGASQEDLLTIENGQVKNIEKYKSHLGEISESLSTLQEQVRNITGDSTAGLEALEGVLDTNLSNAKSAGFTVNGAKKSAVSTNSLNQASTGVDSLLNNVDNVNSALEVIGLQGDSKDKLDAFVSSLQEYKTALNELKAIKESDEKDTNKEKTALENLRNTYSEVEKNAEGYRQVLQSLGDLSEASPEQLEKIISELQKEQDVLDQLKNNLESLKKQYSFQNVINQVVNLTGAIGQMASAISSLKNLGSIWTDDDTEIPEKLLSTIEILAAAIPMTITSINALKEASSYFWNMESGLIEKDTTQQEINEIERKKVAEKAKEEEAAIRGNTDAVKTEAGALDTNSTAQVTNETKRSGAVATTSTTKGTSALKSVASKVLSSLGWVAIGVEIVTAIVGGIIEGIEQQKKNIEEAFTEAAEDINEAVERQSSKESIEKLYEEYLNGEDVLDDLTSSIQSAYEAIGSTKQIDLGKKSIREYIDEWEKLVEALDKQALNEYKQDSEKLIGSASFGAAESGFSDDINTEITNAKTNEKETIASIIYQAQKDAGLEDSGIFSFNKTTPGVYYKNTERLSDYEVATGLSRIITKLDEMGNYSSSDIQKAKDVLEEIYGIEEDTLNTYVNTQDQIVELTDKYLLKDAGVDLTDTSEENISTALGEILGNNEVLQSLSNVAIQTGGDLVSAIISLLKGAGFTNLPDNIEEIIIKYLFSNFSSLKDSGVHGIDSFVSTSNGGLPSAYDFVNNSLSKDTTSAWYYTFNEAESGNIPNIVQFLANLVSSPTVASDVAQIEGWGLTNDGDGAAKGRLEEVLSKLTTIGMDYEEILDTISDNADLITYINTGVGNTKDGGSYDYTTIEESHGKVEDQKELSEAQSEAQMAYYKTATVAGKTTEEAKEAFQGYADTINNSLLDTQQKIELFNEMANGTLQDNNVEAEVSARENHYGRLAQGKGYTESQIAHITGVTARAESAISVADDENYLDLVNDSDDRIKKRYEDLSSSELDKVAALETQIGTEAFDSLSGYVDEMIVNGATAAEAWNYALALIGDEAEDIDLGSLDWSTEGRENYQNAWEQYQEWYRGAKGEEANQDDFNAAYASYVAKGGDTSNASHFAADSSNWSIGESTEVDSYLSTVHDNLWSTMQDNEEVTSELLGGYEETLSDLNESELKMLSDLGLLDEDNAQALSEFAKRLQENNGNFTEALSSYYDENVDSLEWAEEQAQEYQKKTKGLSGDEATEAANEDLAAAQKILDQYGLSFDDLFAAVQAGLVNFDDGLEGAATSLYNLRQSARTDIEAAQEGGYYQYAFKLGTSNTKAWAESVNLGADEDQDDMIDAAESLYSYGEELGVSTEMIEEMATEAEEAGWSLEEFKEHIESASTAVTALENIGWSEDKATSFVESLSSSEINSMSEKGLFDPENSENLDILMSQAEGQNWSNETTMEVVAYLDTDKLDEQMAMLNANPIEFLMQAKISNTKDLVSEVQSAVSSGAEIDPDTLQSLYELVPALKNINLYSEEGQEALSAMSDTLDNLELQSLIRIRDSLKADRDAALEAGENVDDLNEQLEDIETQIKVKIDLDTNIDDAVNDISELDSSLDDLVNSFDDDGFISTDKVTDLMDLCGSEWTQYLVGMKDDEIQLSQEGVDYVKNMAQEKLQAEIDAKKQEAQYNADYYNAVADAYALEAEQYQQAIDDKDETAERDAKIQAGLNQAIANADSDLTNNKAKLLTTDISNTDAATDQEANEYIALAGTTANVANNMIDSFNKVGEAGVNAAVETNKAFNGEITAFTPYKGSADASDVDKEDAKDSEKTINDETSSDGVGDVDTSSTESFEDKKQTALENESDNRVLANIWSTLANSDYIYDSYAAGSSDDSSDSSDSDSSSSDSDSDLDTEEYLEDEYDRYEKVNTAIEKLTNSLSQLQTEESRLIGIDKSKYLKKEIDSLQQQIALQKEKLALEQEELAEKADSLSEYGITFDGEGLIQNYKDVYYQLYDEYNALVDQYNATNDDATKTAMEAAKDRYDKYTQLVEDYDELLSSTIEDTKSELQSLADQIEDIYIQAFRDHLDAIENIKDISDTWADALAAMDSRDSDDVTLQHETNVRKTENQKVYLDSIGSDLGDMVKLWANKNSENFYDDVLGRYGEDSADAFEDYKTVFNDAAEAVQNFRDDIDQLHEDILDKMDEMDDEIEKRQEQYENINDTLQTYYDMYEQMHGDEAYEGLNQIIEAQQEVNAAQIENQKDVIAYYEQQRDMFEEGTEEWEQANDNCVEAQKTLADLVQTSLENQQKIYENNVNKILSDAQTSLLGTDLDWIQTEWELINQNADYYLDDVNKAYNIQKLQSEYLDLLDSATALDTQNQITEQMNQQLAYLREKTNLSSYDVSYAEAQLEILKQQIALEDAQANKSQLKLKRDSQGNYKYVYTANEGDVKTAQSSLLDATNNAYNLSKDQVQQTQEDALSALQEAFSNIQSILTNVNLTVEEKKERIQKIIDNLKEYIAMTGEQLSTAQTNMLESFCQFAENLTDENSLDIQDIYQGIQDGSITTLDSVDAVYTSAITKMLENTELFTDTMDDAHDKWIENLEDYEDKTAQISSNIGSDIKDNVGGAIQETLGDLKELTDGEDEFNASLQKVNAELANWSETLTGYKAQIAQLSSLLTEAYNKIKQLTGEQDEAAVGNSSANGGSGSGSSSGSGTIGSGSAVAGDGQAQVGDVATLKSGHYYVYSSDGSHYSRGNLFSGVPNGVKIDMTSNLQDPSHPLHIRSADREYDNLGWVKLEDLEGFDTGGYTGEWNDGSGKLAMLHSKEIILNADDTQNILKAVESVRAMTSAMKGASLSDAIGSLSGFGRAISTSAQSVDQNVHITAEFPAASSSEDIRQALLGLTNQALHYANQTI